MKTTQQGQKAERAVAELLEQNGLEVIAKNWRTPKCEIDIIAQKTDVIYFVEVKYRSSESQGGGFEYITGRKQRQMEFAAQVWNQQTDWSGDWRLLAAAVSGEDCQDIQILEL